MLLRLFTHLVMTVVVIASLNQSSSVEIENEPSYTPTLTPKQAIKSWGQKCNNSSVDREAEAKKLAEIQFKHLDLLDAGFNVLDRHDLNAQVFQNVIFFHLKKHKNDENNLFKAPNTISSFMSALQKSQIQSFELHGDVTKIKKEILFEFMRVLESGRTFKKVNLKALFWGVDLEDLKLMKEVGMAAKGKVDELILDKNHLGTMDKAFDYEAYNPIKDCEARNIVIKQKDAQERNLIIGQVLVAVLAPIALCLYSGNPQWLVSIVGFMVLFFYRG